MKPKSFTTFLAILLLSTKAFCLGDAMNSFVLLGRGAGSSGDVGLSSIFGNPAGITQGTVIGVEAMYNNLWGLSEYNSYSLAMMANTKLASGAISFCYFGNADLYSELYIAASLAKSIPKIVDIGARVRFVQVGYPSPYDKASTVFFDVGLQRRFGRKANIGFYWENPMQISKLVGYETNELISAGLRYDAASWAVVFADVRFAQNSTGELYLGQEIRITRWLKVSAGVGGRPTKLYVGTSFAWDAFAASWMGTLHPELGMSNGGRISWEKTQDIQ